MSCVQPGDLVKIETHTHFMSRWDGCVGVVLKTYQRQLYDPGTGKRISCVGVRMFCPNPPSVGVGLEIVDWDESQIVKIG